MKPSAILIGLAAGLAAALLCVGLAFQSTTAVALSLATPLPIYIASLGWGSYAGFVAAGTASIVITGVTGSLGLGMVLLAFWGLPSAIAGHLAGLARSIDSAQSSARFPPPIAGPIRRTLDWYPVERIFFAITLLVAVGNALVFWFVDYVTAEPELVSSLTEMMSTQMAQMTPPPDHVSSAEVLMVVRLVMHFWPSITAGGLVVVMVACLHVSAIITRMSGRLPRPKDDIPATTALPSSALLIFTLAVGGCFLDGNAWVAASIFAGAFGVAFTLVGLAAIHRLTRGRRKRGLVLFASYTAIFVFPFAILAATMLGIFETARKSARTGLPG